MRTLRGRHAARRMLDQLERGSARDRVAAPRFALAKRRLALAPGCSRQAGSVSRAKGCVCVSPCADPESVVCGAVFSAVLHSTPAAAAAAEIVWSVQQRVRPSREASRWHPEAAPRAGECPDRGSAGASRAGQVKGSARHSRARSQITRLPRLPICERATFLCVKRPKVFERGDFFAKDFSSTLYPRRGRSASFLLLWFLALFFPASLPHPLTPFFHSVLISISTNEVICSSKSRWKTWFIECVKNRHIWYFYLFYQRNYSDIRLRKCLINYSLFVSFNSFLYLALSKYF